MTRINAFLFIISATAAALNNVSSTYVYEPLYKSGSNTVVRQRDAQAPTFEELHKGAMSSRTLYDSNSISETGWTERNLNFVTNAALENNEIVCNNCAANGNGELEIIDVPNFGKCIGGFCQYQNSGCYYNEQQKYWWKCIPKEYNEKNAKSNEKHGQIIKKDDGCWYSKNIDPFKITSSPNSKNYDLRNPIYIPCNKAGFSVFLDLETKDDIYFLLTDKIDYKLSDKAVEISMNFKDQVFKYNEGVISQNIKGNGQKPSSSKAFSGRVEISYSGHFLEIKIDDEGRPSYEILNKLFKGLYLALLTGKVEISYGFFYCFDKIDCSATNAPISTKATSVMTKTSSVAPPETSAASIQTTLTAE
ncbi:hypothetical protein AYI70_g1087 [Smittium culicis]|uniref:Uncharacterized protein n=1 Tax=Smittium culicis TaxID=133412 RepID=A0A1R1YE54_9FUNG|nr:hypothetical protein AYI70_g1087 [Smittium culicis]